MIMRDYRRWFLTLIVGVFVFIGQAHAALTLTIDSYTTDEVTLTISGTFDADTVGDSPGYLAFKNDWSNNQGVHTEWFSAQPTATLNTITIGGQVPPISIQDSVSTWSDTVFFSNPLGTEVSILAGTAVAGSITLTAAGAFNPADAATLQLVSGFVRPTGADDWARAEDGSGASSGNPGLVYRTSLDAGDNDFAVYDVATNTWAALTPFASNAQLATSTSGDLYGWNTTANEIQQYDQLTDTWTLVQAAPPITSSYGNLEHAANGEWMYSQANNPTLYYTTGGVWQTLALPFSANAIGDYDPATNTLVIGQWSTNFFHAIDMGTLAITDYTTDAGTNGEYARCGQIRNGRFYYQTDIVPVRYLDLSNNAALPVDVTAGIFYDSCAASKFSQDLFQGTINGDVLSKTDLTTLVNTPLAGYTVLGNHSSLTWVENQVAVTVADVTISKTDSADPVTAGGQFTYTLRVDNIGTAQADDVVVTDTLPAGVTLVSTTGCAEDPTGVPTCSLGSIAAGGFAEYTITVSVDPATTGTITNNASVVTSSPESDTSNNATSEDTNISAEAELTITQTAAPDPYYTGSGQSLIYTITVSNLGPSVATNVVVNDTLPALAVFQYTSGCLNDPDGVPDCQLGTLAVGASVTYTLAVTIPRSGGTIVNSVTVTSDASNPNPAGATNDLASQVVPIVIPTLGTWGLLLLMLLLGGFGWVGIRRT